MKDLLSYLDHWRNSVKKRIGPFSKAERKQMLLSDITQNGMRMTSMLIKILVHYSLVCPYILYNIFIFGAHTSTV